MWLCRKQKVQWPVSFALNVILTIPIEAILKQKKMWKRSDTAPHNNEEINNRAVSKL